MKHKEILIGQEYILKSERYSRPAASLKYFKALRNKVIRVVDKYNDLKNKNVIRIEGILDDNIIEMWCSPYDLGIKNESK